MAPSHPFTPPDSWITLLAKAGDHDAPRALVSLSAGRGAYRAVLDGDLVVSRVASEHEPDNEELDTIILTFMSPDMTAEGDARVVAEALYAHSVELFLAARKQDQSPVKVGRLRLQLLDAGVDVGSESLEVQRAAFGEDGTGAPDVVTGTNTVDGVIRHMESHAKTLAVEYAKLAKQTTEHLGRERESNVKYIREVMEVTNDAHAMRLQAAIDSREGFWGSLAGQQLVAQLAGQLPQLIDLGSSLAKLLKAKLEQQSVSGGSGGNTN